VIKALPSSRMTAPVLFRQVARLLALTCLMLFAGAGVAADADANAPVSPPAAAVKMFAVKIADRHSHKPLANLLVEVKSSIPVQCLRAPCPQGEQQQWRGTTDARGVLRFPASLDMAGALVYAYAVGSDFAVDVHGDGKRDARRRPILLLEPPPGK